MAMTARRNNATDPPKEFAAILSTAGLRPVKVVADGVLRRCSTVDHPRSKNGWYVLHADPPAGAFGDWATGFSKTWVGIVHIPDADRQRLREVIERQRAEREHHREEVQKKAIEAARCFLAGLGPATADNPYLRRKGVAPCPGLLADGAYLVVPVLGANGHAMSYQRIDPEGGKKFALGCPMAGGWFAIRGDDGPLCIAEGIATGLSIHISTGRTVLCSFSAGNLGAVARMARDRYQDRQIVICGDNDTEVETRIGKNPGVDAARSTALAVGGLLAVPPDGGDFNDMHLDKGVDAVRAVIKAARPVEPATDAGETYPEPMPLPDGLPPVVQFEMALLPKTLRPWAADIVERMQCPGDYVGVAILAALGAVVGRRIGMRPQKSTDWTVTANQWAMLIGRPGIMKSPAMEAALAPVKRLEALAGEQYKEEAADYERLKIANKLRTEAAEKAARAALSKNPSADLSAILDVDHADPPIMRRLITNDSTAAALGELHRQNPNGLLVYRDELVSLLRSLGQEENSDARGFYLTGWNGDSSYTFDRITRGMNLHIPAVCLSLLGSTQPARISSYIRGAVNGTADDGLLQRFGLTVWPDNCATWRDVDQLPDSEAKRQAFKLFERLVRLDPFTISAEQDTDADGNPEGIPYLRFDPEGLDLFRGWRQDLETRLRSGELHPAFESHLAKYRKLVPGLALLCHLSGGNSGPVGRSATLMALAWSEYLESHARRLYASVAAPDAVTARAIIAKIRSGSLSSAFTVRDIYRPQWSGLTDKETIEAGVKLLVDREWLFENREDTGGRPSYVYRLNPKTEGMR